MFGIGETELVMILVFGFLVFGPDKLPGIGRTVGRALRQFRQAQEGFTQVVQTEVLDPAADAMNASASKPNRDRAAEMEEDADIDDGSSEGPEAPHRKAETFAERRARLAAERAAAQPAEPADEPAAEGAADAAAAADAAFDASSDADAPADDDQDASGVSASVASLYATSRGRAHSSRMRASELKAREAEEAEEAAEAAELAADDAAGAALAADRAADHAERAAEAAERAAEAPEAPATDQTAADPAGQPASDTDFHGREGGEQRA